MYVVVGSVLFIRLEETIILAVVYSTVGKMECEDFQSDIDRVPNRWNGKLYFCGLIRFNSIQLS